MYWWAVRPMQLLGSAPSLFMVVGIGVAIRGNGCWCRFIVVIHSHLFVYIPALFFFHGWPRVGRWVRWRVLTVKHHWAVDGHGVVLVGWVCPVVTSGGHGWFSWVPAVVGGLLCVSCIFVAIVGRSWSLVGGLLCCCS